MKKTSEFEWLGKFKDFKHLVHVEPNSSLVVGLRWLNLKARICLTSISTEISFLLTAIIIFNEESCLTPIKAGCGNSRLSQDLEKCGHFVISSDFAQVAFITLIYNSEAIFIIYLDII